MAHGRKAKTARSTGAAFQGIFPSRSGANRYTVNAKLTNGRKMLLRNTTVASSQKPPPPEIDGPVNQIVGLRTAFHLEHHKTEEIGDNEQHQTRKRQREGAVQVFVGGAVKYRATADALGLASRRHGTEFMRQIALVAKDHLL